MSTDIVIPALGESVSEGVISAWLKSEGEWADRDEPILELETDKITMEIPAPAAGAVHPKSGAGDTVAVGDVVGSIDEAAKKPASGGKAKESAKAAAPVASSPLAACPPDSPLTGHDCSRMQSLDFFAPGRVFPCFFSLPGRSSGSIAASGCNQGTPIPTPL